MHLVLKSHLLGLLLVKGAFAVPAAQASPTPDFTSVEIQATAVPARTNATLLPAVKELAHGTLPNGPLPPAGALSATAITILQLIELNEFFESNFFTSLLVNITENKPGFDDVPDRQTVIDALVAVVAQEQLHGIFADKVLQSQGAPRIPPCHYKFPTATFEDAITFAYTFTDVVLGTLQDAIEAFAINGDIGLERGTGGVIGQEGEQNGFYRFLLNKGKIPSALPFLTTSTGDFAFSSLEQNVIVSCPDNADDVLKQKLKLFGVLDLLTSPVAPKDQLLHFSFDLNSLGKSNIVDSNQSYISSANSYKVNGKTYHPGCDWSEVSLVYINQQNVPVVEKLQNVKVKGSVVSFEAFFPYTANLLNSLTIAAITQSSGPFANATAVADDTLFAPALIEVN